MPDQQGSPVAGNRFVGRRVENNVEKPRFYAPKEEGAKVIFTLNAFLDKRGNLSVDAMWHDNTMTAKAMQDYVTHLSEIAEKEAHIVEGWACCKVSVVVQQAKEVVERVEHSPTATNEHHSEFVRIEFLRTAEGDPHAMKKAQVVAKILADLFNSHGHFQKNPAAPSATQAQMKHPDPTA
jgi:hypothetical protein